MNVVFTEAQSAFVQERFAIDANVETVLILAGIVCDTKGLPRAIVRNVIEPEPSAYRRRTSTSAELRSEYLGPTIRNFRTDNNFVGFIHSHPTSLAPQFSSFDDRGEAMLAPFLNREFGSDRHVSMIYGSQSWAARRIGTSEIARVFRIGRDITELTAGDANSAALRHDRQVLAFGSEGQAALQRLRFSIVGAGGTGSLVAQSLAYLGAKYIRLVDFDTVDLTNLNRLIGAAPADVGKKKVEVVGRYVNSIAPDCQVDVIAGDVTSASVALGLIDTDVVFGCTDSHGSRTILNQLAYQYYLPCFDTGVSIYASAGKILRITGRSQMLSPGLGCLTCGSLLDPDEVRRDLMTPAHRRADPYFVGERVAQPAVVSINSTAASLSVTMALSAISGLRSEARLQVYDAVHGTVRSAQISPVEACIVCSSRGALGRGTTWGLPARAEL
jgi:molybdopterin-synthase adenylyltransferase